MIAISMYGPGRRFYMAERAARRLALDDYTLDVLLMAATSARNHAREGQRGSDGYRSTLLAVAVHLDGIHEIEIAAAYRERADHLGE